MTRGLLLIDGNNIAHAANSATPLAVGDMPTQAIYGFLRTLRPMISTFSMFTPIILWDGRSWRKDRFKDYKASRDKAPETKAELALANARAQFKRQKPFIELALKKLGLRQMSAINYEADDLAAITIAKTDKPVMLISGDKDWIQLIDSKVAWLDPIRGDKLTLKTLSEKLGWNPARSKIGIYDGRNTEGFIPVPSPYAFLEMKALMGDISDEIPGVGGIGPKGAIELVSQFGGVNTFINGVLDHSIDRTKLPKKFLDLADSMERRDNFQRNMLLMNLKSIHRPAAISLKVHRESINLAQFKTICTKFFFKSILDKFEAWCEPFGALA